MDDDRDEIPPELRGAVARLVEESYAEPAEHPEAERWKAYLQGALPDAEDDLLAEHLVRCRDCFDLVQAIDAFELSADAADRGDGAREAETGAEIAAAALSRLVLQQVGATAAAPPTPLAPHRLRSPRRFRPSAGPRALAAALALAVLGLSGWSLRQRHALARQRAPQANVQIVDLESGERAAAPTHDPIARPGPLTLVLHPAKERTAYRLRILDGTSGDERLTVAGLRPDTDFALTVHLPEGLPPGSYRVQLTSEGASGGPILEDYPLHIGGGQDGS